MTAMDPAETELWTRYRRTGDIEARELLLSHYLPWAASVARNVYLRVRASSFDRDDFIQNANIGLLEAMSRYDPERGIAFPIYAKSRVRGAVFNGLKAIIGERPRPSDDRFAERLQTLEQDEGRGAFEEVISSIVDLGIGYLLDESIRSLSRESAGPTAFVESAQIESRVMLAVARLPDKLQGIIRAHYFEYIPFHQIAADMQLTKGRISQLHHSALAKMREFLQER